MSARALLDVVRRHKWKMLGAYVVSTATAYAVVAPARGPPLPPGGVALVDPATAEGVAPGSTAAAVAARATGAHPGGVPPPPLPQPATGGEQGVGSCTCHATGTGTGVGGGGGGTTGGTTGVFDAMAKGYDSDIGMDEVVMGLPLLRRFLMRHARGRVLEVSCGTGRNLKYLIASTAVAEVTATDVSAAMVGVASTKVTEGGLGGRKPLHFRRMDATELAFRDGSFDTVVDTFGLCSCDRPVQALREMARVCRPAEEGGQILLLQHGRSPYNWLTAILDRHAPRHAARWGCWWNRDMDEVVRQAGLQIIVSRRFHLGTSHYIVAAPPPRPAAAAASAEAGMGMGMGAGGTGESTGAGEAVLR